jgi:DNA (cytosine-5)-methyltransferase 1
MGYHRAGFEVVGVDLRPQKHYPFTFVQADALEYVAEHGREFDAIHASPPCQAYSSATADHSLHPDLYLATRALLDGLGLPYAIENVIGAPYGHGVVLCGAAFGLEADGEWLQRHRNFETSFLAFQPPHPHRTDKRPVTITGNSFVSPIVKEWGHSRHGTWLIAQALMGIDWMTRDELAQAIPPAYTYWIGCQLMVALGHEPNALPSGLL